MKQFHKAVQQWFSEAFEAATATQLQAWQAIGEGQHTLVAAPTGSGKTLAAFMNAIDGLVKQREAGTLRQEVSVVYVSPLKALSNDIQRNLEAPLREIQLLLEPQAGADDSQAGAEPAIQALVRTGDTSQAERAQMRRTPPHILVTTPESLYILLTSESGRQMLSTAQTLIVDEVHALIGNKRGAHLALSAERLEALCAKPLRRIGLSATQEPVETVARFLTGNRPHAPCRIINSGHSRKRDLQICLPSAPVQAVMSADTWSEVHQTLERLIRAHTTTLIFVNTRRLAERLAKALAQRLGEEAVTSHHGSLAKEHRFSAEQRLKGGKLRALVATASLELGIDIGDVDLVCQIGSPRAISTFVQRVGRSGHSLGKTPKGRLFPLSRDELVECTALLDSVARGELDQLCVYPRPLDVLAQQLVAEVAAAGELSLDDLFARFRLASPYADLSREDFHRVVQMVADGFSTRRGRRSAYLHLDAVHGVVRPRKGARLSAITSGGAIADQFDYDVILQPDNLRIGTLHEDFSFESMVGDVFQLGNTPYQIQKIEIGKVFVRDAKGMAPNIPFWLGEAPGRTDAMSESVCRLNQQVAGWLAEGRAFALSRVRQRYPIDEAAAQQLVDYLATAFSALGALPSRNTVIFERFFDEAGDQHLVIHSGFGSRANRAWGLALRKRFCRKFNFELQAAALENTIVLSFGPTHSFPLEEPAGYLQSDTVEEVLIQALLDTPMFPTRWRWNATIALAVRRFSGGRKTPPQFQRSNAEDLVAVVFPEQLACAENIAGLREIPDHPLVAQTLHDCLYDVMDAGMLRQILTRLHGGEIQLVCKELTAPSALSEEVLAAKPYAFLDDAPAEERRTALVRTRQFLSPEDARSLGRLSPEVIDSVRQEAWPAAGNADECHDALLMLGGITRGEAENGGWQPWLEQLGAQQRACRLTVDGPERRPAAERPERRPAAKQQELWVPAERLGLWHKLHPQAVCEPQVAPVQGLEAPGAEEPLGAAVELTRMRLQGLGPVTEQQLAGQLGVPATMIAQALARLEQQGYAMQGSFDSRCEGRQWCERGLLARIHRRTTDSLRKRIQPVSIAGYMRFALSWHGLDAPSRRSDAADSEALATVLQQLEGLEAAAGAWEEAILPQRLGGYSPQWLDMLCASGRICWQRLQTGGDKAAARITRQSPIALCSRPGLAHWQRFRRRSADQMPPLSHAARRIHNLLQAQGAQFFDDLVRQAGLPSVTEQGLAELANLGLAHSDSYIGLRALIGRKQSPRPRRTASARSGRRSPMDGAGRWSLCRPAPPPQPPQIPQIGRGEEHWAAVEHIAEVLLRRYGVVFHKLLAAEAGTPPWRDLHYVLRRMEAQGRIRGGRFISGLSGEQFALPEAVGLLRQKERQTSDELIALSAADPLNLTAIITPDERVPRLSTNRLLLRNGKLIATLTGGKVHWLIEPDALTESEGRQKLTRRTPGPTRYRHLKMVS